MAAVTSIGSEYRPPSVRPVAQLELVRRDLDAEDLRRIALETGQCTETCDGALVLYTGKFTGRSPSDRYIVQDTLTTERVAWGSANQALSPESFRSLEAHLRKHLATRETFEILRHAGGPEGAGVRLVTTSPAHGLFAMHLFQEPRVDAALDPITILHSPECFALPELHGTKTGTFIVLSPSQRTILIGGTGYTGEIKKSIFSFLNFELPGRGVLTMHASVSVSEEGDSALFFGLSGTGKTTLSADPERFLVGDDEHGWSDDGLFNLEGGCYAKTINLSAKDEPDIWSAVHGRLALIENVVLDPETKDVIWSDASITENTRGAYPLSALTKVWPRNVVSEPRHVILLTADAFGVLPPVAQLSLDQAVYYFLSGYSAKLAGTEAGQLTPQPTFSTCFGAPFMPLPPTLYARLLRERLETARAQVWLVNTGWVGGGYGEGSRMPIAETRRIVRAILTSELDDTITHSDARFGLAVPATIDGVRDAVLNPRSCWRNPVAYDEQADMLARRFVENFKTHAPHVTEEVRRAGPRG